MNKIYLATQDWVKEQIESLGASSEVSLQKGLQVTYGSIVHRKTQNGQNTYEEQGGTATINHMVNLLFVWTKMSAIRNSSGVLDPAGIPFPTVSILTSTPSGGICTTGKLVTDYSSSAIKECNITLSSTNNSATITAKLKSISNNESQTFYYAALKLY